MHPIPLQARRQDDEHKGDAQAIVAASFEVRRFTREEHEQGDAEGWRLHAGWFQRASGLEWGWFVREIDNGEA